MEDFIPFQVVMLIPSLPHVHFSHFDDICNLGSNGSIELKESMLSLIPFRKATLTLVPECYDIIYLNYKYINTTHIMC
jgi:hypothetical protein